MGGLRGWTPGDGLPKAETPGWPGPPPATLRNAGMAVGRDRLCHFFAAVRQQEAGVAASLRTAQLAAEGLGPEAREIRPQINSGILGTTHVLKNYTFSCKKYFARQ